MITVAFIATAATVFTISTLFIYRQSSQVHNNTRVQTEQLLASLSDAATSQRGYLLTSNPNYLVPYGEAIKQVPAELAAINRQATDASTRTDAANLGPLVDKKLQELAYTISLHQGGDQAAALALVESGVGQSLTNQIHSIAGQILTAETTQLAGDDTNITNLATLARNISLVAMVATLSLTALVYWLYLKAIHNERRLDFAKDEFVALASHQLRTPATGIKSILATLVSGDFGPLNERQEYFMRRALESNERELGIIEELLNVAKADAGRLVLHATKFKLEDLINTIVGEQRAAITEKSQALTISHPDHSMAIVADEEKLYMAIGNLLDNARKYTPELGNISISISSRQGDARVEVTDSGIGIEDEEIEHIFDRFHRANDILESNIEGTGLGLYLASRIAQLHNGSLEASSKPGKGTKFVMILPQGDRDVAEGAAS